LRSLLRNFVRSTPKKNYSFEIKLIEFLCIYLIANELFTIRSNQMSNKVEAGGTSFAADDFAFCLNDQRRGENSPTPIPSPTQQAHLLASIVI